MLPKALLAKAFSCLICLSRPGHTSQHLGCISTNHFGQLAGESDPGAQQVLAHHFPGTLLLPDVKAIQSLPEVCSNLRYISSSSSSS